VSAGDLTSRLASLTPGERAELERHLWIPHAVSAPRPAGDATEGPLSFSQGNSGCSIGWNRATPRICAP
jgi:hypothetical protein